METVPKDVVELMTNDLLPQELVNFCISNIHPNVKQLCNDNAFWVRRYNKDFRYFATIHFDDLNTNAKQRYLQLFTLVSREAEFAAEYILNLYGDIKKFLTKEYKDNLYNYFFRHIIEIFEEISDLRNTDRDDIIDWYVAWSGAHRNYDYFKNKFIPVFGHDADDEYNDDSLWQNSLDYVMSEAIMKIGKALDLYDGE